AADAGSDLATVEGPRRKSRRLDEARLDTDGLDVVRRVRLRVPGEPPHGRPVGGLRLRMASEQIDLPLAMLRDPDVIAVEERQPAAARVRRPEIARGAPAEIVVVPVLEVPDAIRLSGGISTREPAACVSRAVVNEEQLPVPPRLGEHAAHGLRKKPFRIEENADARDEGAGAGRRSIDGEICQASLVSVTRADRQ